MKAYTADFAPALVARDQLEFAKAELSTYQNQRVTGIFNDALAAAITGKKDAEDSFERSTGTS
jgi:sn-glycerol 3-phosphate transport system substrate-binding protein